MNRNLDGWLNVITGLGVQGRDPRTATTYSGGTKLPDATLMDLYQFNGLGKRTVNIVPGDMTRKWFTVSNDTDGTFNQVLKKLQAKQKFKEALIWARLFGGSIIVMGVDDGQDLTRPANVNAIKGIRYLHVFDRTKVAIMSDYTYQNPNHEKYGEPELYYVQNQYGINFYVHETRVLRFDGNLVPRDREQLNNGWGDSVFQALYDGLVKIGTSFDNAEVTLGRLNQGILAMKNLTEKIATKDGEKVVKDRLEIMSYMMSILNMALIDSDGEQYQNLSANIAGFPEMIDRFQAFYSALTGIPITRLFGRSPTGENATGKSDMDIYNEMIGTDQEEKLLPELEKLMDYINVSKEFKKIAEWDIDFNPLQELSEIETAQLRKTVAETDQIYMQNGAVDPTEVAISRFGGEGWSMDTVIDVNIRKMPEEMGGEEEPPQPPQLPPEKPDEGEEEPAA